MLDCSTEENMLLRCSLAQVDKFTKGLLLISLEQNGASFNLLLIDAVMTNSNEAYLKI